MILDFSKSKLAEPTAPATRLVTVPPPDKLESPLRRAPSPSARSAPLDPTTKPENKAYNYAIWSCLAIGAAGLALGTTAEIITWTKRSDLRDNGCSSEGECSRNSSVDQSAIDSHNAWRTLSQVGFVMGGVGAAAGVTLWLTRSKDEGAHPVAVSIAPSRLEFTGSF